MGTGLGCLSLGKAQEHLPCGCPTGSTVPCLCENKAPGKVYLSAVLVSSRCQGAGPGSKIQVHLVSENWLWTMASGILHRAGQGL